MLSGPSRGKFLCIFQSVLCRTLKVICVRTVIKINKLCAGIFFLLPHKKIMKTSKRSLAFVLIVNEDYCVTLVC